MSILDLNATQPSVTPAVESKEYPLKYARKIMLEGTPQSMRAYVELQPYRRILDADGNVVGEELKTPEVDGDITVLEIGNILPQNVTPEGKAMLEGYISQYLQAGGDLRALVMAGIVIVINQLGVAQGKLAAQ